MKRCINFLAVLILMSSSCTKGFLDITDPGKIATQDFYNDANSLNLGLNATYGTLQEMYGKGSGGVGMYIFGDLASDNSTALISGAGLSDFEFFITAPENASLQTMWTTIYKCIARCNVIIDRSVPIPMDENLKKRYVAEAKFIRALSYFNAVRIWGRVPLVTKELTSIEESLTYGRESIENVYIQIETDLKDCEEVLPSKYTANNDLGRATSGAAKALLAKVYLTQKKYLLSEAKLKELLPFATNPFGYDLLPNYMDIFSITNELNKEIIFSVRYTKGGLGIGSPFFNWFLPEASGSTIAKIGGAQGFNTVRKDLFDAFAVQDKRRDLSLGIYSSSTNTAYYTKKYFDTPTGGSDSDNDWILLRYADVVLMYAEVLNELGKTTGDPGNDAESYLNKTRLRAGLLPFQGLSQGDFRLAIETERRLELNMEGHRWFDLVRNNRAVEVMNQHFLKYQIKNGSNVVVIDASKLIFPIPIRETQTNPKIEQNP